MTKAHKLARRDRPVSGGNYPEVATTTYRIVNLKARRTNREAFQLRECASPQFETHSLDTIKLCACPGSGCWLFSMHPAPRRAAALGSIRLCTPESEFSLVCSAARQALVVRCLNARVKPEFEYPSRGRRRKLQQQHDECAEERRPRCGHYPGVTYAIR
ncbi:hypothetical protein BU26DRAFT_186411 [Trematosphaeria pertusa]|uniref:Uncharacterized protein n=1 Tax=Trematosphaeria pertusa TaxID=390896 RepID=A0A6A6HSQ8_9PLEO|nr:uncharacterized protein BU26DRAFT_186411 [Trematosphaeria pertusa]KAF2241037.1 hypothetical protein BU26DRAFT_186411 [Trematosphaeria pertusa]